LLAHDGLEFAAAYESRFNGDVDVTTTINAGLLFPSFFIWTNTTVSEVCKERHRRITKKECPIQDGENLTASNSEYRLNLKKFSSADWTIDLLHNFSNKIEWKDVDFVTFYQREKELQERGFYLALASYPLGVVIDPTQFLPAVVSLPQFQILQADVIEESGIECLKMTYNLELSDTDFKKYGVRVRSGSLTLIPGYWLIKRMDYREWDYQILLEYEYDFDSYKIPLAARRYRYVQSQNKNEEETIYSFRPMPDKSGMCFHLSGYGIPEPDFGHC